MVSHMMAERHSSEYREFRHDMIEAKLLGSDGVCRYCLSVLTGQDCFPMAHEEFTNKLASYVASRTSRDAEPICRCIEAFHFLAGFMVNLLYEAENGGQSRRRNMEQRAIELLLGNPSMTDEAVQGQLATTRKQMDRWVDYQSLRRTVQRAAATRSQYQ
jgi:hypothetical protein